MKSTYLLALAMLAVFVFAGGIAYADQYDYNYNYGYQAPRMTQPAATGAGPSTCCPAAVNQCPAVDCCTVTPTGTCGAFCASGQNAPGWPYNWCSEYWLRPNSNF
jgi:hypothetical protein